MHRSIRAAARQALALALLAAPAAASEALDPAQTVARDPWFQAGHRAVAAMRAREPRRGVAKNVILFVGDGMSPTTITAARILEGQQRGQPGEEGLLSFERLPYLAHAKTWNTDAQVPDSAGTMTAMMSGVKTKAGVIGLSDRAERGDPATMPASRVPTLFEVVEARGLATGIVTTARITHATPAACYAHAANRGWESDAALPWAARRAGVPDIARQLVAFDAGDGLEVALGGGRAAFLPREQADPEHPDQRGSRRDGRDLVAAWRERFPAGRFIWSRPQLEALDLAETPRLFGLFSPSHMAYEVDRAGDAGGEPSLSEMTKAALAILARHPKGFLLMVEAGRIDHAHHANNAYRALTETIELARAVEAAQALTSRDDTLIVVTADHGHPLTLSGHPRRGNPILGLSKPPPGEGDADDDATGRAIATLAYATGPGNAGASELQPAGPKRYPHRPERFEPATGRPDLTEVDTEAPEHLQESLVPLPSGAHSGEDVTIHAGGPGAELFQGVQEQHYVYHAIVEALGWTSGREAASDEQAGP
ncbi:MAG: alkaline phosphatase [Myxococcota bacterium]